MKGRWHLLASLGAVMIWSTSFVGTKLAFLTFPPFTLGALRFVFATVLLGSWVILRKELVLPDKGDRIPLVLSGLLGISLYFAMENSGVRLTSASTAALIVAVYPVITVALETWVYRRRPRLFQWTGAVLAAVGVVLVSWPGAAGFEGQSTSVVGVLILLGAGVVWAFYNFVTKRFVHRYPGPTTFFYQALIGTVFLLPLTLIEYREWQAATPVSLGALFYLSLFCSVLAFLLYNFGLRKISSSTSVTLMNLVPIMGVAASVVVLRESLTVFQMIGGAIAILGVVVSVQETESPQR